MFSTNPTPNPLTISIKQVPQEFDVVMYQANGDQIFWLDEDAASVFFGTWQQFGAFTSPRSANPDGKDKIREFSASSTVFVFTEHSCFRDVRFTRCA
jgi:hypothetical protein